MTSDANLRDYDELSVPEKILRLQDLWDKIVGDSDQIALTDAQRDELKRRLQDHYDGKVKSAPWSEVRERIRKER